MKPHELKAQIIQRQLLHIENWFTEHKAQWIEGPSKGPSVLKWEKPDSNTYGVNYIFFERSLSIVGDIGDAIYEFSANISPKTFTNDFHYFQTKLRASGDKKEWHEELAKAVIREEAKANPKYNSEILEGLEFTESPGEWMQFLEGFPAYFEDDLAAYDEIGLMEPIRHRAYLIGLKKAAKQLWPTSEKSQTADIQ